MVLEGDSSKWFVFDTKAWLNDLITAFFYQMELTLYLRGKKKSICLFYFS